MPLSTLGLSALVDDVDGTDGFVRPISVPWEMWIFRVPECLKSILTPTLLRNGAALRNRPESACAVCWHSSFDLFSRTRHDHQVG